MISIKNSTYHFKPHDLNILSKISLLIKQSSGGGWRVAGGDDVQMDGVSLRERRWGAGAIERG